jgi:outer membrane biogenesis lipoprotein LolB
MMKTLLALSIAVALLASCRSTKKIQTAISKTDTVKIQTPPSTDPHEDSMNFIKQTFNSIEQQKINFTTFSAKIDVDYRGTDDKKYDVNAHLRMYKDSVIWISVTAILGIEGMRVLITKDSVKLLNKQDKVYTARSVSYLQEVSALPLDLHSLQDLLIGNPVFIDSGNIVSYSNAGGFISLLSIGDFFKNLLTLTETEKLLQSSKLDDTDAQRNRTCHLSYEEYENKKGVNFSSKRFISVVENKKLEIRLHFRQYEFNETLSFPFNIPKNYKSN